MKQHIKHIIILALMLVGNITAWATDETLTFTFYGAHENSVYNSYLVHNSTNYKLNPDNNPWFTVTPPAVVVAVVNQGLLSGFSL